jgi:hypothetical protein
MILIILAWLVVLGWVIHYVIKIGSGENVSKIIEDLIRQDIVAITNILFIVSCLGAGLGKIFGIHGIRVTGVWVIGLHCGNVAFAFRPMKQYITNEMYTLVRNWTDTSQKIIYFLLPMAVMGIMIYLADRVLRSEENSEEASDQKAGMWILSAGLSMVFLSIFIRWVGFSVLKTEHYQDIERITTFAMAGGTLVGMAGQAMWKKRFRTAAAVIMPMVAVFLPMLAVVRTTVHEGNTVLGVSCSSLAFGVGYETFLNWIPIIIFAFWGAMEKQAKKSWKIASIGIPVLLLMIAYFQSFLLRGHVWQNWP